MEAKACNLSAGVWGAEKRVHLGLTGQTVIGKLIGSQQLGEEFTSVLMLPPFNTVLHSVEPPIIKLFLLLLHN